MENTANPAKTAFNAKVNEMDQEKVEVPEIKGLSYRKRFSENGHINRMRTARLRKRTVPLWGFLERTSAAEVSARQLKSGTKAVKKLDVKKSKNEVLFKKDDTLNSEKGTGNGSERLKARHSGISKKYPEVGEEMTSDEVSARQLKSRTKKPGIKKSKNEDLSKIVDNQNLEKDIGKGSERVKVRPSEISDKYLEDSQEMTSAESGTAFEERGKKEERNIDTTDMNLEKKRTEQFPRRLVEDSEEMTSDKSSTSFEVRSEEEGRNADSTIMNLEKKTTEQFAIMLDRPSLKGREKGFEVEAHVSEQGELEISFNVDSLSPDDIGIILWLDDLLKSEMKPNIRMKLHATPVVKYSLPLD